MIVCLLVCEVVCLLGCCMGCVFGCLVHRLPVCSCGCLVVDVGCVGLFVRGAAVTRLRGWLAVCWIDC